MLLVINSRLAFCQSDSIPPDIAAYNFDKYVGKKVSKLFRMLEKKGVTPLDCIGSKNCQFRTGIYHILLSDSMRLQLTFKQSFRLPKNQQQNCNDKEFRKSRIIQIRVNYFESEYTFIKDEED